MSKGTRRLAKSVRIDRISAIWIIPIITCFIGIWMIYSHYADQGKMITLIANDASGITAGKTVIKSRSVDVGIIEVVTLSKDFNKVIIQGRIYKNMESLIKNDSRFWIVKPEISLEGVSGLGTLLSGFYIELNSGNDSSKFENKSFNLFDTPPLSGISDNGLRIKLNSDQNDMIPVGAPVTFRGYKVGSIEKSELNIASRQMEYQLFIAKPYDVLVTDNARFWKDGGINLSLSSKGASLDVPSLGVLLSGGVSFDIPQGSELGASAKELSTYQLYPNKLSIQNSQYTQYHEFLLFFNESISGLNEGSPVQFRGIQLGVVSKAPFFSKEMIDKMSILGYDIPVLIRIEPGRMSEVIRESIDLSDLIIAQQKNGLRASLKSSNLFTGAMFVDLDFYPELKDVKIDAVKQNSYGYDVILTVSSGLSQIQSKISQLLDHLNELPLNKTVNELNQTLSQSQELLNGLNTIVNSKELQTLPKDLQVTITSLNTTLQSLQPGSSLHAQIETNLQQFEQTMGELNALLETLNDKSNALIFQAPPKNDKQPKAKGMTK